MKKVILISLLILFVVFVIVGIDFFKKISKPYMGYDKEVKIYIKKGSSVTSIAKLLSENKIISSYFYFKIYYKMFYSKKKFQSGEYLFSTPLTMRDVIEKLIKGEILLYKMTVKEGLTLKETALFLENNHNIDYDDFVKGAKNLLLISDFDLHATDLEGYLFPDTYLVRKEIKAEELVEIMVKKFRAHFTDSMKRRTKTLNLSIREVVILASLIEKETSSRDERCLISSVFHNRLRIGMPMGCDPTIVYALKLDNKYTGKLRWKDLKYNSPYNTRIHNGLPPGPICSPGFASIEAALFPDDTKYLYFVAKDAKSHYFSKTLKEHNWAVRKYIKNKKR